MYFNVFYILSYCHIIYMYMYIYLSKGTITFSANDFYQVNSVPSVYVSSKSLTVLTRHDARVPTLI